jgi:predicted secreted Zn-dependent protease
MMKILLLAAAMAVSTCIAAEAASVSRTFTYFSIGGTTLEEIEQELARRGPQLDRAGPRHPGATRMEFTMRVTYGERGSRCSVIDANVSVKADMILPRWRKRNGSEREVRMVLDTLAADIKRHEESHVVIARNHAREMEDALKRIRNERDCDTAARKVQETNARILEKHDREQARFDRVEARNFESRMLRLLRYRLERIEAGQIADR